MTQILFIYLNTIKQRLTLLSRRLITYIKSAKIKLYLSWKNFRFLNLDLIILDDIFPHLLSAFRIAEYNEYLDTFPKSLVYSTGTAFTIINELRSFCTVVKEYEAHYPKFAKRVLSYNASNTFKSKLVYMIFINNAYKFIDIIEKNKLPFVFTLYPGGGFQLNENSVDEKLRRVFFSPCFRKVIVTQKITYDYLLSKNFVTPDQIEFIYGGVFPSNALSKQEYSKKYYQKDKETFDICFVANKYMDRGIDKGYDTFIEVAKTLATSHPIRFHIVGSFCEDDIDISEIREKIIFYGTQYTSFFSEFYPKMDIILSPNIPFTQNLGGFDGFPTGCCVEAAFAGVAVFCTDILSQNIYFQDTEDIVLVSTCVHEIVEKIHFYYKNPEKLYSLAAKGQKKFQEVFSTESQIQPRIKILQDLLSKRE